ncbi:hypothetical protein ACFRAO_40330 [Streptomyces sp. NPDC056656]|uniref:hypothetical protein n=1 Tax=Streptomyces sp. NPDC056656 TaxID=3345895 RepID=UPI0036B5549E
MASDQTASVDVAGSAFDSVSVLSEDCGLTVCEGLLAGHGYETVREAPTRLRLRNCPFQPLAAKAPDLVCGMNQAFLSGYLTGLEVNGVKAVLTPEPGECCVRLCPNDTDRDEQMSQDH